MEHQHQRPERKTITTSGTYRMKVIAPRLEWIKHNPDTNVMAATLLFVDADGNELKKYYSNSYGDWKSLAALVGAFSGTFVEALPMDASPAQFLDYIAPATKGTLEIGVEYSQTERNGKVYNNYKLTFPRGSKKPVVPKAASDEGVPF